MALGVIVPFPYIPTVTKRLHGIQSAALERGYLTTIAFHNGQLEDELREIEMLFGRVDGLVITPVNQTKKLAVLLRRLAIPVVCMSEPLVGFEADFVSDDDMEGGRIAARHLVKRGRTRIAYLGENNFTPSDLAILMGMREVLHRTGQPHEELLVLWGNLNEDVTRRNVDILVHLAEPPNAVVCFSDMTAMWTLQQLEQHGIRVPNDIAIIGYDNTDFAALARVPLTSISQPNFDIGYRAAHALLDRLRDSNRHTPPMKIIFPPTLVVRASSQC